MTRHAVHRKSLDSLVASEVSDPRVIAAFRHVDRGDFVPSRRRRAAYVDRPVPIPYDQVTSQPTLIARMVEAAAIAPEDRVLEVGTGYGFQTAVLSHLAAEVVSVERHADLAAAARANLERAGVAGVTIVIGDGSLGHEEGAPYDAIVVSAGAERVPPLLARQLAEGGRLVIPISGRYGEDVYLFVTRDGALRRGRLVSPARFVPLVPGVPPA
jgi:protein-L-isoaspartate(D-aspartate) O-methyltransferase